VAIRRVREVELEAVLVAAEAALLDLVDVVVRARDDADARLELLEELLPLRRARGRADLLARLPGRRRRGRPVPDDLDLGVLGVGAEDVVDRARLRSAFRGLRRGSVGVGAGVSIGSGSPVGGPSVGAPSPGAGAGVLGVGADGSAGATRASRGTTAREPS